MRITAQFYSVDDAEFAAAALRRNTDGVFDVAIREKPTGARRDGDFAPMGFFTNISTGNASGVPVPVFGDLSAGRGDDTDVPKSAVVDVICRPSSAKLVSGILLNKGGHDLKAN